MSSWRYANGRLLENGINPLPGDEVSYIDVIHHVLPKKYMPIINIHSKNAKLKAAHCANPWDAYFIEAKGQYKEVLILIDQIEKYLGAIDLTPMSILPFRFPENIVGKWNRFKYLIRFFAIFIETGKNLETN